MEATPIIELRAVRSVRGGYEALRDVSLSLERGQTLFVMGGSGSGKSVLIKTAAGIALPAEGEVCYRGKSLARLSAREDAAFRKASGFVFQDAALWSNQSLFDNLALPVRLHEPAWSKADVERAVRRAAELVGYGQDLRARPADLSSGERKLIGLARALVLDPELIFMDDPASVLDEKSAARVPEIVDELRSRGRTMLIACASSDFASRCADYIVVLHEGAIAASGPYAEAAAWTDPLIRGVTGRLKARAAKAWEEGLAGAWVSAFAEGPPSDASAAGEAPLAKEDADKHERDGMSTLGDIINDLSEEKDDR